MTKVKNVKVIRLMTQKEIQDEIAERERSKQQMEMDCNYMIKEFNRKQERKKNLKVS